MAYTCEHDTEPGVGLLPEKQTFFFGDVLNRSPGKHRF